MNPQYQDFCHWRTGPPSWISTRMHGSQPLSNGELPTDFVLALIGAAHSRSPKPISNLSPGTPLSWTGTSITRRLSTGRLARLERSAARKNPIGIIPKPLQPGKFRLIVDLSSPVGGSVNDGIDRNLCSLQYVSVDQAARLVAACGKGALMAKTDLCSAYRQVPVHRDNQHLLGIEWRGQTYIDKALPFGLRSAPKISTAVADSLAWALHCSGVSNSVHYLDDFLFWGPAQACLRVVKLYLLPPPCAQG